MGILDLGTICSDFLFKFLVIGSAGTGKSCLLHQFIENKCEFLARPWNCGCGHGVGQWAVGGVGSRYHWYKANAVGLPLALVDGLC